MMKTILSAAAVLILTTSAQADPKTSNVAAFSYIDALQHRCAARVNLNRSQADLYAYVFQLNAAKSGATDMDISAAKAQVRNTISLRGVSRWCTEMKANLIQNGQAVLFN